MEYVIALIFLGTENFFVFTKFGRLIYVWTTSANSLMKIKEKFETEVCSGVMFRRPKETRTGPKMTEIFHHLPELEIMDPAQSPNRPNRNFVRGF